MLGQRRDGGSHWATYHRAHVCRYIHVVNDTSVLRRLNAGHGLRRCPNIERVSLHRLNVACLLNSRKNTIEFITSEYEHIYIRDVTRYYESDISSKRCTSFRSVITTCFCSTAHQVMT